MSSEVETASISPSPSSSPAAKESVTPANADAPKGTLDVPNSSRQSSSGRSVNGSHASRQGLTSPTLTSTSAQGGQSSPKAHGASAAPSSSPSSPALSSPRRASFADSQQSEQNHSGSSYHTNHQHRHQYQPHQAQHQSPVKQPQQPQHSQQQRSEKSRPAPLNIDQHLPQHQQYQQHQQHQHIHQQNANAVGAASSAAAALTDPSTIASSASNTLGVPAMQQQMASMGASSPLQYGQSVMTPMTSPSPMTPGITSPGLEHPLPTYNPAHSTYLSNTGTSTGAAAPYPGRAASLPGSIHHGQHGGGRHPRTSSHNHNAYNSHQMAAAAAAGLGIPSATLGHQQAVPASLLRGSPQLRAQLAQHLANGNLPGAFGNLPAGMGASTVPIHQHMQPAIPYERYTAELTNCIIAFLSPILPTEEEYRIKEATRRQLERLAGKVSPGSKLLAFGSMANGFALRNSDMDLCCLIGRKPAEQEPHPTASQLVEMLAKVIREETDFNVLPLPKARIPIIKISRASTPELPYEISCDIGFENRLALENTRLLLSYAMVDPPRLRTLVLFLKVWTKRRKLNSPYMGTLSSYGYTLLVLFFLTHVKRPAVLPNLQRIPPTRPLAPEEIELNGHNIYFYDDMATLRKEWQSQNTENVAELLIDFFRYFAKEFAYTRDVISLRTEGGLMPKDGVTWAAELCIEDPFQLGYNVSRTVTKDGLYTIRGEFMRSMRILQNRHQRVSAQLAELCEEREDIVARAPDTPPPRNKYSHLSTTPMNSYMSASDARSMYDSARRGSNTTNASGFGGSFAFEEMARGLGRQRGQMAYPTAAMLAPLSQNGGLSPRPTNISSRVSRDMSTPGRTSAARNASAVASSARSDDGKGSLGYEENSQAEKRPSHASARTSPTLGPAVPHGLPPSNAVGEAWAFGSEIVFGSERFQLHPHRRRRASTSKHRGDAESVTSTAGTTTSAGVGDETIRQGQGQMPSSLYAREAARTSAASGHPPAAYAASAVPPPKTSAGGGHRASRSFSDGQNRSQSVPRVGASGAFASDVNGVLGNGLVSTGTNALAGSSAAVAGHGSRSHAEGLYAPMASLSVNDGSAVLTGDLTDTNSSGRQSPGASSDAPSQSGDSVAAPMREYTAAWAQRQQQLGPAGAQDHHDDPTALQMDYIPRGSDDGSLHDIGSADEVRGHAGQYRDAGFGDGDSDLSEGMLDELSRISQIETEGRGHHSRNSSYAEAKLGFGASAVSPRIHQGDEAAGANDSHAK